MLSREFDRRPSATVAVAAAAAAVGAVAALWALIRSKPLDGEGRGDRTAAADGDDDVEGGAYNATARRAWTIAGLQNPSNLCYMNAILQVHPLREEGCALRRGKYVGAWWA
ncbi:hypothetical protein CLOM_g11607 [Closterium sp. NIES-68]|nr:hypothetical protein CLOM_g11607 [Closterium sp. NIES-68]